MPAQKVEKRVWAEGSGGMEVLESDRSHLRVRVRVPAAMFSQTEAAGTSFLTLSLPAMSHSADTGMPDLPVLRRLLTIPGGGEAVVEKVIFHTRRFPVDEEFHGDKIFPRQPSLPKSTYRQQHLAYNRRVYVRDAWVGDSLVILRTLGTLRGEKLALLTIAPFRYNPARDLLQVAYEVEVTLVFSGSTAKSATAALASPAFSSLKSSLLNAGVTAAGKGLVNAPVRYVILTDTLFRNTLQEFIAWKRQTGFRIEVIYKTDPGVGSTADSISHYLQELYHSSTPENPAPSYLLIVGDTPQIPPSAVPGHVTDLYYATYDGDNDYLPDLYYGRIPARDTAELRVMLDKILEYERYTFPDPSFLQEAVMVAGVDKTYGYRWGNGQINYAVNYYVNEEHGFVPHVYLYPESGDSAQQIIEDISNGVSLVNYTGHGTDTSWMDPSFRLSDIQKLNNSHKYPLIITNGCETASFGLDECFGEALVRAKDKGGLAYIGCSNDSYWDEDYYWAVGVGPIVADPSYKETSHAAYDRLFHDHGEPPREWYVTADQIIFAGNLQVMEGNPYRAKYYWEIYHLFGDPSMMPYLAVPLPSQVFSPDTLPAGAGTLRVVTEPQAYIGVVCNDSLVGAALTDSTGMANILLPALPDTGRLIVTVTRQNRIPFIDTVTLVPDSLPFVQVKNTALVDTASNGNGLPDAGETLLLDVVLKNTGSNGLDTLRGVLTGSSPWVTVLDSLSDTLSLAGGEIRFLPGTFRFRVEDSIPDGARVTFRLTFRDGDGNSWDHWLAMVLNAPVPAIRKIRLAGVTKGDSIPSLDPGEEAEFIIHLTNDGNASLQAGYLLLDYTDNLVSRADDSVTFAGVPPGGEVEIPFFAQISEDAPYAASLQIAASLFAGGYSVADTFVYPLGVVYEDFEGGSFASYPWQNDSPAPWEVTGETAWRGEFSAVSGEISDNQTSVLKVECKVPDDDTLSFYLKVSSEEGYDFLHFTIDTVEQEKWSGKTGWVHKTYPVTAGWHTFIWTYSKDGSESKGLDRAWIDYILFPKGSFSGYDTVVSRHDNVDPLAAGEVSLYPNPATEQIIVKPAFAGKDYVLMLFDMTGRRRLLRESLRWSRGGEITIPLAGMAPGTYFILLTDGQRRISLPFIKR